jgi:hypothetical protein
MTEQFINHKVSSPRAFMLAGNAYFTLRSEKTGTRYTYAVSKADAEPGKPEVWFVGFLTGPDNTSDYQYLGILRDGRFKLTAKSKLNADSLPVKAFAWTWEHLDNLHGVEVWHEGRCGRCGRRLTVPESIERGFGPECITLLGRAA